MKQASLADIEYVDALRLVGLRKEALDSGSAQKMSSESLADSFFLRDIGVNYSEKLAAGRDPALNLALLGGGLGAVYGAGKSLLSDDEDERKSLASNTLLGGVSGAALGGGVGLLANPKSMNKITSTVTAPSPQAKQQLENAQARSAVVADINAQNAAGTVGKGLAYGSGAGGVGTGYLTLKDQFTELPSVVPKLKKNKIYGTIGDSLDEASATITEPPIAPGNSSSEKKQYEAAKKQYDAAVAARAKARAAVKDIVPETAWESAAVGADPALAQTQRAQIAQLLELRRTNPKKFGKELQAILKSKNMNAVDIESLVENLSPSYSASGTTRPKLYDFKNQRGKSLLKALRGLGGGGLSSLLGAIGISSYNQSTSDLVQAKDRLKALKENTPGYFGGDN